MSNLNTDFEKVFTRCLILDCIAIFLIIALAIFQGVTWYRLSKFEQRGIKGLEYVDAVDDFLIRNTHAGVGKTTYFHRKDGGVIKAITIKSPDKRMENQKGD